MESVECYCLGSFGWQLTCMTVMTCIVLHDSCCCFYSTTTTISLCLFLSQLLVLILYLISELILYLIHTGRHQTVWFHCRQSAVHIPVNWRLVYIFIYTTNLWTFLVSRSNQFRQVVNTSTSITHHVSRLWYVAPLIVFSALMCYFCLLKIILCSITVATSNR